MKQLFLSQLTPMIGIDLGSSRTRIWNDKDGTILDEATCVAVDNRTQKVVAVGDGAAAMQGRVGSNIDIFFPVERGEVADPDVVRALLKVLLQRIFASLTFFRPAVMVSVPTHLSLAKREQTVDLIYSLGAREVLTINQSLAAAIGSGVPIADASGSFLLHLGGGVVEAAIISLGSTVTSQSNWYAGSYLDERLVMLLKETQDLVISLKTAERLKKNLVSLVEGEQRSQLVSGQDLGLASPKEVKITTELVKPAVVKTVDRHLELLKLVLSNIPPELTVDVIDKGVLLSGGLAQIEGLSAYLIETLGVPVSTVEEPDQVVIKGIATALEHLDEFKESLGYLN